MKKIILMVLFLAIPFLSYSQNDKTERLEKEIAELKLEVKELKEKLEKIILTMESNNKQNVTSSNPISKDKSTITGRCQAKTKKGTQCSRNAKPGSIYCWQHGG